MVLEEHGTLRRFSAGETIFERGDEGQYMYVVDSGQVEIIQGSGEHELRLSLLGPEEIFGEMALFGGHTRSASARAVVSCGVREISKEDIYKIVRDPLARHLLVVMGERLREVDSVLERLASGSDAGSEGMRELKSYRSRFG